jgi:hypothetical protein
VLTGWQNQLPSISTEPRAHRSARTTCGNMSRESPKRRNLVLVSILRNKLKAGSSILSGGGWKGDALPLTDSSGSKSVSRRTREEYKRAIKQYLLTSAKSTQEDARHRRNAGLRLMLVDRCSKRRCCYLLEF